MEFLAKDIEKICNIKRNRLQAWIEHGWVAPSIKKGEGAGSRNIWNEFDLFKIMIFKKVIESGIARENVAQLGTWFKEGDSTVEIGSYKKGQKPHSIQMHFEDLKKVPSLYFVFFRKAGNVTNFNVSFDLNLAPLNEKYESDDLIGINAGKIIKDIDKSIKRLK